MSEGGGVDGRSEESWTSGGGTGGGWEQGHQAGEGAGRPVPPDAPRRPPHR